jgi:hypothetical protein
MPIIDQASSDLAAATVSRPVVCQEARMTRRDRGRLDRGRLARREMC